MKEQAKAFRVCSKEAMIDGEITFALVGVTVALLVIAARLALSLPVTWNWSKALLFLVGLLVFLLLVAIQCSLETLAFTAEGIVLNGSRTVPWETVEAVQRRECRFLFSKLPQQYLRVYFKRETRIGLLLPRRPQANASPEIMDEIVAALVAVHPVQGLDIVEPPQPGANRRLVLTLVALSLLVAFTLVARDYEKHTRKPRQSPPRSVGIAQPENVQSGQSQSGRP